MLEFGLTVKWDKIILLVIFHTYGIIWRRRHAWWVFSTHLDDQICIKLDMPQLFFCKSSLGQNSSLWEFQPQVCLYFRAFVYCCFTIVNVYGYWIQFPGLLHVLENCKIEIHKLVVFCNICQAIFSCEEAALEGQMLSVSVCVCVCLIVPKTEYYQGQAV